MNNSLRSIFNAEDGRGLGLKATTAGELANAIKKAREHRGGPILIECQIAHDDCTPQGLKWGSKIAAANKRPPSKSKNRLGQTVSCRWPLSKRTGCSSRRRNRRKTTSAVFRPCGSFHKMVKPNISLYDVASLCVMYHRYLLQF
jgi:hypothetical protein